MQSKEMLSDNSWIFAGSGSNLCLRLEPNIVTVCIGRDGFFFTNFSTLTDAALNKLIS